MKGVEKINNTLFFIGGQVKSMSVSHSLQGMKPQRSWSHDIDLFKVTSSVTWPLDSQHMFSLKG